MNSFALISNLLGGQGLFLILIVALLFGAKRLPELGRSLGETIREFSKSKDEKAEEEREKLEPKK